jgi:hypothetical protein
MSDTTIIELERLTCATCGVVYAVPDYLCRRRANDDEPIHCPSGHENFYKSDREIEAEESLKKERDKARAERDEARREQQALKERIIQLRGELDQAEARAIDKPKMVKVEAVKVETPAEPVSETAPNFRHGKGHFVCPACEKEYRLAGSFRNHMRDVHKIEPVNIGED